MALWETSPIMLLCAGDWVLVALEWVSNVN